MSGHTEGPWAYRTRAAPRKIMLKRQHWEVGQPHGFGVAIVFGDEDNACLIAAAPDLLTALTKLANEVMGSLPLMEPLDRRELGNTNYTIMIQRAEEARAVIAKATQPPQPARSKAT